MDETPNMAQEAPFIPKQMRNFVQSYPVMRKKVRLNITSGSTTVGSNGSLRVRLPSNSLVDLNTFQVHAKLVVTGNNAATAAMKGSHQIIKQFGANISGVTMGYQNQNWNQSAQIDYLGLPELWDTSNQIAGYTGLSGDNGTKTDQYFVMNYWPNSPISMGVISTAVLSQGVEFDIQLAGNNALFRATGVDAAYELTDVACSIEVLELPNDGFSRALESMLSRGGAYQKAVSYAEVQVQDDQGSNSFNVSTKSLDYVGVGIKANDYATTVSADAGTNLAPALLRFDSGLDDVTAQNAGVYFQINSQTIPSYGFPFNSLEEQFADTRYALSGVGDFSYNKLFIGGFPENSVILQKLCLMDSASKSNNIFNGIDLSGGQNIIRIETKGLESNNKKLLLIAKCSGLLAAQGGGVVSYMK